jgi:pyrroloquinoline-quinone synthase
MYAYEAQVPEVALDKMKGLQAFYGLTQPETLKFFEVHSVLDEDHSDREAVAIAESSENCETEVELALKSALDAWWGFLDCMEQCRQDVRNAAD